MYELRLRGYMYKTFFMLNSAEHQMCPANESQISNKCKFLVVKHSWDGKSLLLIIKMLTTVDIYIYISREKKNRFRWVEDDFCFNIYNLGASCPERPINLVTLTLYCIKSRALYCINRTWVFNALTFARSIGRCWKPRPEAAVFNTSQGTWRMWMH